MFSYVGEYGRVGTALTSTLHGVILIVVRITSLNRLFDLKSVIRVIVDSPTAVTHTS